MVDEAPAVELVLPDLAEQLEGRVLVGHNIAFDRRVLRQAFARAELEWPDVRRRCARSRSRGASRPSRAGAGSSRWRRRSGIEVGDRAPRAGRRRDHRARAVRAAAAARRARRHGRRRGRAAEGRGAQAAPSPRGAHDRAPGPRGAPRRRLRAARRAGVYLFRNAGGQVLYIGKSVSLRSRARSHFQPSSASQGWVAQATMVDHRTTSSELGALVLEQRLIKEMRPPGNVRMKHDDPYVYLRCRLDIAYPVLEVAPAPAQGALGDDRPAARPARGDRAHGAAQLALHAAPLRPRAAPARASLRLRADGPLPLALPQRPRPQPLPPAPGRGARALHGRRRRRSGAPGPRGVRDAPGVGRAALRARGVAAPPAAAPARAARPTSRACRRSTPGRGSSSRRIRAAGRRTRSGSWAAALVDWGPAQPVDGGASLADRCAKALRSGDGRGSTTLAGSRRGRRDAGGHHVPRLRTTCPASIWPPICDAERLGAFADRRRPQQSSDARFATFMQIGLEIVRDLLHRIADARARTPGVPLRRRRLGRGSGGRTGAPRPSR